VGVGGPAVRSALATRVCRGEGAGEGRWGDLTESGRVRWSLRRPSQSVGSAEVGEEGATVARPASSAHGPLGEFSRSTAPPQDSVSRKRPKAPGDNARPTGTPDALHVSGWPVPDPCVAWPTAAVPQLGHCSDAPFRDWRHVRPPQLIPLGGQRLSCIPCCRCRAWPPRPSGSGRPDIVLP